MSERKLAQPGDMMFERNLSILAAKGKEIEVFDANGGVYRGFTSGLDDEYLQLCMTDDQAHVMLNRSYIVNLIETGLTLEELEFEDPSLARRIKERVRTFQTVSGYHVENQR